MLQLQCNLHRLIALHHAWYLSNNGEKCHFLNIGLPLRTCQYALLLWSRGCYPYIFLTSTLIVRTGPTICCCYFAKRSELQHCWLDKVPRYSWKKYISRAFYCTSKFRFIFPEPKTSLSVAEKRHKMYRRQQWGWGSRALQLYKKGD